MLLAQKFLPDMVKRGYGVFACVSSSGDAPFMGAYEVFKTAQVELANTLAPELEDKGEEAQPFRAAMGKQGDAKALAQTLPQ